MVNKPKLKDVEASLENLDIDTALQRLYSIEKEFNMSLGKLIEKYIKRKSAIDKELERYDAMCRYEKLYRAESYKLIAGIDEAGRGPLAGPVVAAAVILPEGIFIGKLNDSKLLSPKLRNSLFDIIVKNAIAFGIGIVDEKCIDEINILNATKKAMEIAVKSLKQVPDILLIDAIKLETVEIKQVPIIKGDSLSVSIAAASILAKVTRDRIIEEQDKLYPQYGFSKHKGYGTLEHINAIKKFGICPIHRLSFCKSFSFLTKL